MKSGATRWLRIAVWGALGLAFFLVWWWLVLDEEYLCQPQPEEKVAESYRFLWVRSFHPTVLVRLSVDRLGKIVVVYKETTAPAGGHFLKTEETDLLETFAYIGWESFEEEFAELLRSTADESLWSQPFRVDEDFVHLDGADWVLEGLRADDCHVVYRWSPSEQEPMRRRAIVESW